MKPRRLSPPGSVMMVSRFLHKGAKGWGGGGLGSGFPYTLWDPLSPWNKTIPGSRASCLHPVERGAGTEWTALVWGPCHPPRALPMAQGHCLCCQSSQRLCHSPCAVITVALV